MIHNNDQYIFYNLQILIKRAIYLPLLILIIITVGNSQINSTSKPVSDSSTPKITLYFGNNSEVLFLNKFNPGKDSCAEVEIALKKSFGISFFYKCNYEHKWLFDSTSYTGNELQRIPVTANITSDKSGFLISMQLYLGEKFDSSKIDLKLKRNFDINFVKPDSVPPTNSIVIKKASFLCEPRAIVIIKQFSYPPGYMKREPVYNYPELKMFHCGGSVHMPTSESVRMRGIYINEYHSTNPPDLKYEEPKKFINEKNDSKKPRKKRFTFLKIKPL